MCVCVFYKPLIPVTNSLSPHLFFFHIWTFLIIDTFLFAQSTLILLSKTRFQRSYFSFPVMIFFPIINVQSFICQSYVLVIFSLHKSLSYFFSLLTSLAFRFRPNSHRCKDAQYPQTHHATPTLFLLTQPSPYTHTPPELSLTHTLLTLF